MGNIITDHSKLRVICEPVKNRAEGGVIARKLWATLDKVDSKRIKGVGLSAPQIGIYKRVCVIHVGGSRWVLMNPTIVESSKSIVPFKEGCLSFPGVVVDTWRMPWVVVEALNLDGPVSFGPRTPDEYQKNSLLEAVVVQHEINHLNGVLMDEMMKEPTYDSHDYQNGM